jgi:hypothetical protein
MAQLPFDWSELTRSNLYSMFYSLNSEIVGKELSPSQIQKRITRHVKAHLPLKLKKCIYTPTTPGFVFMGGVYYSDLDRKRKPAIEVNFNYNPVDKKLKLTKHRFQRMASRFADVVLHEIVHQRQFRSRNFKNIPGYQSTAEYAKERKKQEYYGDRDEMGAHAFNCACELIDRFGYDPTAIAHYLDSNKCRRHKNSTWNDYLKAFDWNHDHPIIRRMRNLILRQLENAYYGKPFKTTNHLTY